VSGPLWFRQLLVRRMPGFPGGGLRLDALSPGINLVHGPNASGKTTLARALQSLLWARVAPAEAWLEGRFDVAGASWSVRIEAGRPSWQREGRDAPAPPLPPADDRDRYVLSLHGLLAADDRGLAERIRVESAGGYDVRAAGESLGFGAGGRPRTLLEAQATAARGLEAARLREADLREEASALERLRERRRLLDRAAAHLPVVRRALELARARESEEATRRALAAFPDVVGRLRGDELDRLAEWDESTHTCDLAVAEAEAETAATTADLEATGLGDGGPSAAAIAEIDSKLEGLRRLDDERARAAAAHADARGRREAADASLSVDKQGEPGAGSRGSISAIDADRLDQLMLRAGRLRERRAALEHRLAALGAGPIPAAEPIEAVAGARAGPEAGTEAGTEADAAGAADAGEAIRVLRAWLRTPAENPLRALALIAVAALGIAGLAATIAGAGAVQAVGAVLLLLAIVLALLLATGPARVAGGSRSALEQQARRLGAEPPTWTVDAAEDALDALERRAAAERVATERRQEAERVARDLPPLEAEERALAKDRKALADELGLVTPSGDLALHVLASRLRQWDQARAAEAGAAMLVEEIEVRRADVVADLARLLSPYGYGSTNADGLAGALQDLRARRERHQAAATALRVARADRDRAVQARHDLGRRRVELFDRLGIAPHQAGELRRWSEQVEAYQTTRSELDLAARKRAEAEAALAELGAGTENGLGQAPVPVLEEERDRLEAAAVEERALSVRIAGIEARLDDARSKHDVEAALADVGAATADLIDRRNEDIEAQVGAALVDWLGERASDHNRPAVFHRARDLFGLITRGRYRLDMEDTETVGFRAYDNITHRGHGLDELSSGTRVQLLLAVRMAFVETQETGAALPLLLDEVLANCDDDRATAIIDAALALARAGRQVFYFTAQADELVKWRSRLEKQQEVDWCVRHILEGASVEGPAVEWPPVARLDVPATDGLDHAAYGRALPVPPFDPWADGVGGLHLWYLVEDVDALREMLTLGIERWGQLEHLADGGHRVGTTGEVIEEARRAAGICDRFRRLWRRGRDRPVDRSTLADSGAISEVFLEPVAVLCDALNGDGRDLLDALADRRIPRFQAARVEELRAYLYTRDYLSDEEPLHPEEIRAELATESGVEPTAVERLLERLVRGVPPV
jgi:energy-coupling factor transporter ATP-binding protein EcfA2